jgi:hypothetical protein
MTEETTKPKAVIPTALALEDARKEYIDRVWSMNHDQLFSELMRVHTESAKMLQDLEAEINRLISLYEPTENLH